MRLSNGHQVAFIIIMTSSNRLLPIVTQKSVFLFRSTAKRPPKGQPGGPLLVHGGQSAPTTSSLFFCHPKAQQFQLISARLCSSLLVFARQRHALVLVACCSASKATSRAHLHAAKRPLLAAEKLQKLMILQLFQLYKFAQISHKSKRPNCAPLPPSSAPSLSSKKPPRHTLFVSNCSSRASPLPLPPPAPLPPARKCSCGQSCARLSSSAKDELRFAGISPYFPFHLDAPKVGVALWLALFVRLARRSRIGANLRVCGPMGRVWGGKVAPISIVCCFKL